MHDKFRPKNPGRLTGNPHLFALGLMFLAAAVPAGPLSTLAADLELGGYYENNLQAIYTEETDEILLSTSKLRLDFISGGAGNELEIRANINTILYHGATSIDVAPFLPEDVVDSLLNSDVPTEIEFPRERIYLDNAFLTWRSGGFRLRAGKQQLSWGTGYSINPTDLFHSKDPIDPTYEKEGVNALRVDYRWGIGGQLALIAAPGKDFGETGYALRLGTHVSRIGYDMAITLHDVVDSTSVNITEMTGETDTDSITINVRSQDRQAAGFEFSGELLGLGVWFEGNYNWMEIEDDFTRAVFGFDYTLNNGLYMMVEALYNTRAEEKAPYPLEDWIGTIYFGEPVGRYWVLAGMRKELTDLSDVSIYLFASPDGSMMVNPRLGANIGQNADLTIFAAFSFGDEEGQYPPGLYSLFSRVTVYF